MLMPGQTRDYRILVAIFTYDRWNHSDITLYMWQLQKQLSDHPKVEIATPRVLRGYPTTRQRNFAMKEAYEHNYTHVLMIDNDMAPDYLVGRDPDAVPFVTEALDFMATHEGPCVVAAPYTGAPDECRVMAMEYTDHSDKTDPQGALSVVGADAPKRLGSVPRPLAAEKQGVQRAGAMPTGLMMIDTRVCDHLKPPLFEYEYADEPYQTQLFATEDVVFTRNLSVMGIPIYCAWSSWAGHWKDYLCRKPGKIDQDFASRQVAAWCEHAVRKKADVVHNGVHSEV